MQALGDFSPSNLGAVLTGLFRAVHDVCSLLYKSVWAQ
jgi:hypothetical protein